MRRTTCHRLGMCRYHNDKTLIFLVFLLKRIIYILMYMLGHSSTRVQWRNPSDKNNHVGRYKTASGHRQVVYLTKPTTPEERFSRDHAHHVLDKAQQDGPHLLVRRYFEGCRSHDIQGGSRHHSILWGGLYVQYMYSGRLLPDVDNDAKYKCIHVSYVQNQYSHE